MTDGAAERLEYEVVDVFTDAPFAGNPLAVVFGADDLDTASLQALANEFQLSETAFPMRATDGADYRLRIFTPVRELPFAGHPSVGTAWVLAQRGVLRPGAVVQSCGAGLLSLGVAPDGGPVTLTGGVPSVGPELDAGDLLAAVGLTAADLAGAPREASCGLGFVLLPVVAGALSRVAVDLAALRAAASADGGVSVVEWDGRTARCRVFAVGAGVAEDPATGSAALALGTWLVASAAVSGNGTTAYDVVQGVELGRPSRLVCSVTAAAGRAVSCTVGGDVAPIASGWIRRP